MGYCSTEPHDLTCSMGKHISMRSLTAVSQLSPTAVSQLRNRCPVD